MAKEKIERNLKMLELWELGMSYAAISRIYEVSHQVTSKIVKHYYRLKLKGKLKTL